MAQYGGQSNPSDLEGGDSVFIQRRKKLRTTYGTQANALLRKNLVYQWRNWTTNCCLVSTPIALCVLLFLIQTLVNSVFDGEDFKCGCVCVEYDNANKCLKKECGLQYSKDSQVAFCEVPSPAEWPAFQQTGRSQFRAVQAPPTNLQGLPSDSCRTSSGGCPTTFLYTGANRTLADGLADYLLAEPRNFAGLQAAAAQSGDFLPLLASLTPATPTWPYLTWLVEPAFSSIGFQADSPLYVMRQNCSIANADLTVTGIVASSNASATFQCLEGVVARRENASAMNRELYDGYFESDATRQINEYSAAYDFQSTSASKFDVNVFFNNTYANNTGGDGAPPNTVRFARAMNLAANAFVRYITGDAQQLPLLFVKEYPKPETRLSLDFSSLLGPLFFMWLIQLLLPVILSAVVYEKQQNLRTMMKMHGLGDLSYWTITYIYFLAISAIYMLFFLVCGSVIGLQFFRLNSYGIQIIFYFVFINMQIAFAFVLSAIFSSIKTATVVGYLYVFGTGLLGAFLYQFFLEDPEFSRNAIFAMQLIPAFALFRGLYEFAQYSFVGNYLGTDGMQFSNLGDDDNGILGALGILAVEWALFLPLAYYLDQVVSSGSGVKKHPLFFLHGWMLKKPQPPAASAPSRGSKRVEIEEPRPDVEREMATVESLLSSYEGFSIVCDKLRKVYPPRDGNPEKVAVRGMSVAIPRGECFGMLGPNGAGKTTSINMMIGFLTPSAGTAVIEGLNIQEDMDAIYSIMGVCPQHDLLWEQLSGREHLLFYGRLKNLRGRELTQAVDESLKSVELYSVGNKRAGQYSGGMKRRLSVAISLIGNPLVVYMDEPSTGLDPASRMNLWKVVKAAKRDRAIILTTHSMEEAEALCDRLGIFVNGEFQCIGNPKELTSRFGGSFVFTVTTPVAEEQQVEHLVQSLTRNGRKVYSLAGTQKFELPTTEVDVADVFGAVEKAKSHLTIQAWGISNTTLEDVFIKVAKGSVGGSTGKEEQ